MKRIVFVVVSALLLGVGCAPSEKQTAVIEKSEQKVVVQPEVATVANEPSPEVPAETTPTKPVAQTYNGTGNIQIYMINVAREGTVQSGKVVGCGDGAVAVNPGIPTTTAPLSAAIKAILAVRSEYYGQTGLFNPAFNLGKGSLKFVSATVKDGLASIYVTGETSSAGVCDDARFQAQFEETAKQFPTVQKVDFYLNGKKFFGEGVRG